MFSLLLPVIYLAFISLGLPDSLLGAAWPSMDGQFGVPMSWVGGISMVICAGTIVSSLLSDRLTLRFGPGTVTAVSVAVTAAALFAFSFAPNYWMLLVFAIPYGLGAGGVDAALNNYVALHYESRHMSWLHCMWGVGASAGPYVMGFALSRGQGWHWGYRYIAIVQVILTAVIVLSLPLWNSRKDRKSSSGGEAKGVDTHKPIGVRGVVRIRGAKAILLMFFCYCSVELTAGLWASSYLVMHLGVSEAIAANWASLFYLGITAGRGISGFLTMRFDDSTMIRIGQAMLLIGVVLILLPLPGTVPTCCGLVCAGLGCAPIYPCLIHSTPTYFGADQSQAIVGVQMACAYMGSMIMPPLFGVIAQHTSIAAYPWYLLILLGVMAAMHELLRRQRADI